MLVPKLWVWGVLFWMALPGVAQENVSDYIDMSLEELMDVQVVSGARSEQSLTELAVPVSVLTAEEIRNSGRTSLPEILALIPGVDVQRVDRTRVIVGVRGMLGMYSDRTLVLINGRDALNPVFGAPDWLSLPVLVEDIDRIEVLRGPGGGVWGANAFTGVINIITRSATQPQPSQLNTTVNDFGDSYSQLKVAHHSDTLDYWVSAGYEDFKDSDQAGAGRTVSAFPELNFLMGYSGYEARDQARVWRFDSDFVKPLTDQTSLNVGAAHASGERGDREFIGQLPQQDGLLSMTRVFGKLDHDFDDQTQGYLQWFGNYSVTHSPEMLHRYAYYENDLEGQLQHQINQIHRFTLGGNLRWTHLSSENGSNPGEVSFVNSGYDEYWAGLYLVDRIELHPRWTLETQGRLDRYSYSGGDWSGRVALLHALDDAKNHVLRVSAARSFRAPGTPLRELRMQALYNPYLGTTMFNLVANPKDLINETIYSLEAGYVGHWTEHLMVRVDGYYQRLEHILGSISQTDNGVTNSTLANLDGANACGGEGELDWSQGPCRFSAWYAYNGLVTDQSDMSIRAYYPARHKAGLRCHLNLPRQWYLQTNYTYNDAIHVNASSSPSGDTGVNQRLDMTLSRSFFDHKLDCMIGVADVLNKTTAPVYDVSYFTSYETPGRSFFARLKYSF